MSAARQHVFALLCTGPPGIIKLSSTKGMSEELLMALGEAAAATAGDVTGFDQQLMLWSNLDTITDCVNSVLGSEADAATEVAGPQQRELQQQPEQQEGSADMDVDKPAAAGVSTGHVGVQEYLLQQLREIMAVSPREEVR